MDDFQLSGVETAVRVLPQQPTALLLSCDSHNCDRHNFLDGVKNNADLGELVRSYALMGTISRTQRLRAYKLLDEVVQRRLFKNAYLAIINIFNPGDDAAKRLYDAYRQHKQRERRYEEAEDSICTAASEHSTDTSTSIDNICHLITQVTSVAAATELSRFTAEHLAALKAKSKE